MAGYDATNRLIQAGCRRIVYYGSATAIVAQGERLDGYRRALAEAGIAFDEALVVNVLETTNAAAEAARVFDEINRTASSVSTMCAPPSSMKLRENAECASEPTCR